jgi:hypothetical protein
VLSIAGCALLVVKSLSKRKSRSDRESKTALHDSAAERVAGLLSGLLHDAAAERVTGLLVGGSGLSHDSAAKRVAGLLGRGGLGGRHFESWG